MKSPVQLFDFSAEFRIYSGHASQIEGRTVQRAICLGGICLSMALTLASPAWSQDFCTDWKAVLLDGQSGFTALRGVQTRSESSEFAGSTEVTRHFEVTHFPTGAVSCEITDHEEPSPKGRRYPNFKCELGAQGLSVPRAEAKFVARFKTCARMEEAEPPLKEPDEVTYHLSAPKNVGVEVSVTIQGAWRDGSLDKDHYAIRMQSERR